MPADPFRHHLIVLLLVAGGACTSPNDTVESWRLRSDAPRPGADAFELNADEGWLAPERTTARVEVDRRFRLRVEIERASDGLAIYRLEFRRNGGPWLPVEGLDHPYPDGIASPITSVVSTEGFVQGEATGDLLPSPERPFVGGFGVADRTLTPIEGLPAGSTEWEWALVVRYFSDGALRLDPGDSIEYRVVTGDGRPLDGATATVMIDVPPGHLGGTFVETPGRIGPFEAPNGDLYFVQEPAETWNVFMMLKSTDGGRSWAEVDGAGRPPNGDLEAVAIAQIGPVLHILHQADSTWAYRFGTSDHPDSPDRWIGEPILLAEERDPPTQVAALVARTDGSLVAVYGGDETLHLRLRSPDGEWGDEGTIDADAPGLRTGPVLGPDRGGRVWLAYADDEGNGWVRRIEPSGRPAPARRFTRALGRTEAERGAILSPVPLDSAGEALILYRDASGRMRERVITASGDLGSDRPVAEVRVASGQVDSDQVTADAVAFDGAVHLLVVEEESGSLLHLRRSPDGAWGVPVPVLEDIRGQWIRGSILTTLGNGAVYGWVVDAGSDGGSGFNRFGTLPLGG